MLTATREPDQIRRWLDQLIATDPVRHTILGTIRDSIDDPDAAPWCAQATDGDGLTARSHRMFPVVIAGRWDESSRRALAGALLDLPDLAGLSGPEEQVGPLAEMVVPATGRTVHEMRQRLFRLDALTEPTGVSGRARRAGDDDRDLVIDWYRAFGVEAGAPAADIERAADGAVGRGDIWLWSDGENPVALAARRPVVAGSARVGPVYTPPERRGHGYGSAATAAATRDVLAEGAVPVLFTDLANPVSNSIYPKLGYYPVEDRLLVLFD
jgi:GNAT superfamily N-acetyltransferase